MPLNNYRTALLILLQQTNLKSAPKKFLIFSPFLNKLLILFFNLYFSFKPKQVFQLYQENNKETANLLSNFISAHEIKKVLDIGCGIAGYHSDWMKNNAGSLFLFDKSTFNLKSLKYGMGESERYYNSLPLARRYLSLTGIDPRRINLIETGQSNFNSEKYDLVVSFISLGFHYHVNTYFHVILNSLNKNSFVILDIRNNSSSFHFIEEQSQNKVIAIYQIMRFDKFTRFFFQKI